MHLLPLYYYLITIESNIPIAEINVAYIAILIDNLNFFAFSIPIISFSSFSRFDIKIERFINTNSSLLVSG